MQNRQLGENLNEWYREVFLRKNFNLARKNIFSKEFERSVFGDKWMWPRIPHFNERSTIHNQQVFKNFFDLYKFERTLNEKYLFIEAPLRDIYAQLFVELKFNSPRDEADYSSLLYVLERCIDEDFDTVCTVFLLSNFDKKRQRSLLGNNEVKELFQGRNESREGLRDLKGKGISIQLYVLDLFEEKTDKKETIPVVQSVPVIATHIPKLLSQDIIRWAT